MSSLREVRELVERFRRNEDVYRSSQYNETQLRRELIDPLFAALGWDVANVQGYAEAYKDVVHEDAIKVGGATKAPDYCFRIGGTRKFFVEAKRPGVRIKDDAASAYQLRRYAWSAKLSLSILTNFAEFSVYDCRIKPDKRDPASTARVLYLTCEEYASRWDELAGVFGKEAVYKGSFDRYAESTKRKRGTAEVDAAFLKEIEAWREKLARNIALRNPELSQRELNFAVQRTIDRIVFLRICEDRGVEEYGRLMSLLNGNRVYPRLCELFRRADERYNSGLFHFRREKGRAEPPDELTPGLVIDDRVLKDIIRQLYYPDSPYEFSVLPTDILGQVYEQFLGKIIRLTPAHRAVVEEKPEVRKAGGVYYTPTYIVDYIVEHTVGKLLEGKTPQEVGGLTKNWRPSKKLHPLRILDPACGSGSFLLGAYQYLLDWYRHRYVEEGPEKHTRGKHPRLFRGPGGEWRLTTTERKRILLTHIYGVDIDPQAVEVTKLSLLLKVLEGETEETLDRQLKLFHERALPDLGRNIKCGNSLIGPDFYETAEAAGLDREELLRINPFDWHAEFPDFKPSPPRGRGEGEGVTAGFDAVIGNPPYIRIQALREWHPAQADYFKRRYIAASKGNFDIYVLFVERGLELLNKTGRLGFILPNKFFTAKYGEPLRKLLSEGRHVSHIVHFGDQQVFTGATTYTALLVLEKAGTDKCQLVRVSDVVAWKTTGEAVYGTVPTVRLSSNEWDLLVGAAQTLLSTLQSKGVCLGELAEKIFQGLVTSADPVYVLTPVRVKNREIVLAKSRVTGRVHELELEVVHPLCKGARDLRRYSACPSKLILFPYDIRASEQTGRVELISPAEFSSRFPRAWEYLQINADRLRNREKGKMRQEGWYGYVYPKSITLFSRPKILTPSIAHAASFSLDRAGQLYFTGSGGGGGGGYGIILKPAYGLDQRYVLGLLNSCLLDSLLRNITTKFRGGYLAFSRQYIERLPIRTIDFSDPADKARHDKMVELVQRMLDLHEQLAAAKTEHEKIVLQRRIAATDRQIDQLVYELYGLTQEEIKIVEEASREVNSG